MLQRIIVMAVALAAWTYVGCKEEAAPKPEEKKSSPSTQQTPYYPPPPPPPPFDPGEEESGRDADNDTGCDSSDCESPGSLQIEADGSVVTTLTLNQQKTSAVLTVKSSRYDERNFKLRVTSDVPAVTVNSNDQESVTVSYSQGSNNRSGSLRIIARDLMRCERDGKDDCSDLDSSYSNDETLTLPWSSDGVVGISGGGDGGNDIAMQLGLQILGQMLGIGGGQGFFGGANQVGGGFGNAGWGNQNNQWGGNWDNGWGNQQGGWGGQNNWNTNNGTNWNTNNGTNWNTNNGTNWNTNNGWNTSPTPNPWGTTTGAGQCRYDFCSGCRTQVACENVSCTWDINLRSCR